VPGLVFLPRFDLTAVVWSMSAISVRHRVTKVVLPRTVVLALIRKGGLEMIDRQTFFLF